MPVIAVVGDQCVGDNISGTIVSGSPTSNVRGIPIARVNDVVLIIGISPLPPGGEISNVPIEFCPAPCVWFYIEQGTIISSLAKSMDNNVPIACGGSMWKSPHFNGVIEASLAIPLTVN